MRPVRWSRVTNPFAAPGSYASSADRHGPAGHHTGVDFGKHLLPLREIEGLPVRAAAPGTVVIADYNDTMGHWVGVYNAKDDVTITYWHMHHRSVRLGQHVARGDVLGAVGSSGNSTAPHLHVQANPGRGFDYSAHVSPWPWMSSMRWWRRRLGGKSGEKWGAEGA